jgi:hypothetical protein
MLVAGDPVVPLASGVLAPRVDTRDGPVLKHGPRSVPCMQGDRILDPYVPQFQCTGAKPVGLAALGVRTAQQPALKQGK